MFCIALHCTQVKVHLDLPYLLCMAFAHKLCPSQGGNGTQRAHESNSGCCSWVLTTQKGCWAFHLSVALYMVLLSLHLCSDFGIFCISHPRTIFGMRPCLRLLAVILIELNSCTECSCTGWRAFSLHQTMGHVSILIPPVRLCAAGQPSWIHLSVLSQRQ